MNWQPKSSLSRAGFTLVEMLVAVTLVLIIMSMFAQIFQIAGGSITKQRGLAENDQRVRTMESVLNADFAKRTFRVVVPWASGEDGTAFEALASDREGYLYVSENDPASDIDDLLQFTIRSSITTKSKSTDPFFGRAEQLAGSLLGHPNQPEADDSRPDNNGTGQSTAAEVCYFIRGKNLYRRMLLVREPLDLTGATDQPTFVVGSNRPDAFDWNATPAPAPAPPTPATYGQNPGGTSPASGNFWRDFDYSAFPANLTSDPTKQGARFHGLSDLSNANALTFFSLGKPQYRFGHSTANGRSKEFASNNYFIGRYLQEETSHPAFQYPHGLATGVSVSGNPMTVPVSLDPTLQVVADFANGPRRGEDLLLPNVQGFDVKLWDEAANSGLGAFVDIGHAQTGGDFLATNNNHRSNNVWYGPDLDLATDYDNDGANFDSRVFDTWHPSVGLDFNGAGGITAAEANPPYRFMFYRRTTDPGSTTVKPDWSTGLKSVGDIVFPKSASSGLRFHYVCVTDHNALTEPAAWPTTVGGRVKDSDPSYAAATVQHWEAVENWRPVRAIQITVRFLDITSEQMRQMTLVHSLID